MCCCRLISSTGKTVGELPVSKGKSWGFFGGAFAIIGAIAFGILALLLNM